MKKQDTQKRSNDIVITALWGGGIAASAKEHGISAEEVTKEVTKFAARFKKECEKRGIDELEYDRREALKEEMLGLNEEEEE